MELNVLKDEIAKGLRTFKAFENAHEVLTELMTLEAKHKDFKSRVDGTAAELQALKDEAAKVNNVIVSGKDQAAKLISDAKDTVGDLIMKANEKAAVIITQAENKCADKAVELDELTQKCLHAQNDIADIADVKAKLQLDIDALNAIKEKARKFLG